MKIFKNNITRILLVVIILAVCALGVLVFVPFPNKIDKDILGIRWNESLNAEEQVTLSIYGKYYDYILELKNHDYYEGEFKIYNQEDGDNYVYISFLQIPDSKVQWGYCMHLVNDMDEPSTSVFKLGKFSTIMVEQEDGTNCVFPAVSLEKAKAVREEMNHWQTAE